MSTCAAQTTSMGGPVLGYLFDYAGRAIRPMLGIPGSASLGDALTGDLDFGSVAPNGAWAVGVRENQLVLVQEVANGGSESTLASSLSGVDRAVWAADSSSVVIYSSASRTMRRIALDSGVAQLGPVVDLSTLGPKVSGIAASTAGSSVLASIRGGDTPGLYWIHNDTPPVLVLPLADPGPVTIDA